MQSYGFENWMWKSRKCHKPDVKCCVEDICLFQFIQLWLGILQLVVNTETHKVKFIHSKVKWFLSGCAVERRTVNRGDGGSIPPTAISKLRQFRSPHICLCLSEETRNSRWSLLSGVYARGSKRSHTRGKYVTYSGLTNSREKDNSCISPNLGCLEVNHLRPSEILVDHPLLLLYLTMHDNNSWNNDARINPIEY